MEKPRKTLRLSSDIGKTLVCKDRDDFTKFFYSLACMFAEPSDELESKKDRVGFMIESMQMLMHEYMALVLSGELEPYNIKFGSEEDRNESIKAFRQGMIIMTERLMKSGVPMREKDGRYEIQYEELLKRGKKEFDDGV